MCVLKGVYVNVMVNVSVCVQHVYRGSAGGRAGGHPYIDCLRWRKAELHTRIPAIMHACKNTPTSTHSLKLTSLVLLFTHTSGPLFLVLFNIIRTWRSATTPPAGARERCSWRPTWAA